MRGGGRLTSFQAGALAIAIIAVLCFLGFSKDIPFTKPFELKATFSNAQNIALNSPVRIAGVDVGKVSKVEPASDDAEATTVTMKLDEAALPIHEDAEVKIRPRIFLEGNFFVDIRPGRPDAEDVENGGTIPASQTAAPVQIDEVLGSLQTDSRQDLQDLLKGYGEAIGGEPQPGEDSDQDESTRGQTAGQSLNDALRYSPGALRGTAIVNDALLGTETHDLSKLIAGGQKVSQALSSREAQLKDLITNFNITTGALASEETALRETIRRLPRLLDVANPTLDSLNRAFPPTRAFAREILPGVRETPATIDASFPWIAQTRRLVSKPELQGLVGDLQPAVDDLAQTTDAAVRLLPELDRLDRCFIEVILPTGDKVIQDGPLTTGIENYKEFFQTLVGLSGESQNFDGNGSYTRFQPGGGSQTVSTGSLPGTGPLFGNAIAAPLGTKPAFPRRRPPYRRDVACHRNRLPNLDAARVGAGP
jgi:phospholipid/cholesterol/gamma-HCH transport system substrate-binding protein